MRTSNGFGSRFRCWGILAAAALGSAGGWCGLAKAEPVVYRGTVVTDVRLGAQYYPLARLKLTFKGDSDQQSPFIVGGSEIPSSCGPTGYFFWITTGEASFSFESQDKTISGSFLPKQIFVALDTCNGGIGFGSFTG